MNILVNARPLTGLLTGIARYVRNLYSCMEQTTTDRIDYFNGARILAEMPEQNDTRARMVTREQLWRLPGPLICALRSGDWLRHEHRLRRELRRGAGYDVYHDTGFFPSNTHGQVPVVQTVYDLSLRRHPRTHPRERVCFYELFIRRRLPMASHFLTISEYVRQEILDEFKLPPEMVTTVPLAPDPHFSPRPVEQVTDTLARLGIRKPYLLFVGTLEPRKNLQLLIKALPLLRREISLVLAGWSGWGDKAWLRNLQALGLAGRVILPGHIGDEDLARLYSGASALVYPSLYEGFGLPILEAMACGCPVVCANSSCLPETAGGAAILVSPHDPEELAAALESLLEDEAIRAALIARGLARAARFSWAETARQTRAVLQGVSRPGGGRQ